MTAVATVCTWHPACPGTGTHRMERKGRAVSLIEFVCDSHVQSAEDEGYVLAAETAVGEKP